MIDLREEQPENAFNPIRVNSESVSNEINESNWKGEKRDEQRT
jgi:hypothetical protein